MVSFSKAAVLFVACVAASVDAGTVTCTAKPGLCDGQCILSTTTPSKGDTFKISVNGTCSEAVSAPIFDLSMHYNGIPVLTKNKQDACKDNDFELPLNLGDFKTSAVQGGCMHPAGDLLQIDSQALVGKLCPNGKLLAELVAKDKAGKTLFTVDVEVDIKGEDEESAPAWAINSTSDVGLSCTDNPPDKSHTCAQQKSWGKCSATFMQGHCCKTCYQCKNEHGCGSSPGPAPGPPPGPPPGPAPGPAPPFPGGSALPAGLVPKTGGRCGIEKPSGTRKTMQDKIRAACKGCSGGELATVLAMAMIESDDMCSTDTSKGSSSGRSNFSPFNLNADELSKLGCNMACAQGLGQHCSSYNVPAAVQYVLRGLRGSALGNACDFLNYHRDGSTGWSACKGHPCGCSCNGKGCDLYQGAVADGAKQILGNHEYGTMGYRVCEKVQHI